jgi:hypothetical protein
MFDRERVIATSSVAVFFYHRKLWLFSLPRVAELELQPVVTAYNRVREAKMYTMYIAAFENQGTLQKMQRASAPVYS